MRNKRLLSTVLSLAFVLTSPGLAPYQAAASILASPTRGWAPAIKATLPVLALKPAAGPTADVERVLGHLNLDLTLERGDAALTRLVSVLPAEFRASPKAFARLTVDEQAAHWGSAIAQARKALDPEVKALVEKARQETLTPAEAQRLKSMADFLYLLSPELVKDLRAALDPEAKALIEMTDSLDSLSPAEVQRLDRRLESMVDVSYLLSPRVAKELGPASPGPSKGRRLGDALLGRKRGPAAQSAQAVKAEIETILDGAHRLTLARPAAVEKGAFARDILAPYSDRALERVAQRFEERGLSANPVYAALLNGHRQVFGGWARPKLVNPLRKSGDWTDFVATLTIAAAGRLRSLILFSRDDAFNMRIPAWHEQSGKHELVGDYLEERFGNEEPKTAPGIPLFKGFGIPVGMTRTFPLILAYVSYVLATSFFPRESMGSPALYWIEGVTSAVLLFGSVLLHEFGHALTARKFGIQTKRIMLNILGGVAEIEREPRKAFHEFLIALAGPVVSAALAVLFYLAAMHGPSALAPVMKYLMLANGMLAVFNMIPAFPMDGGRVLRSGLWGVMRDHYRATRAAGVIGIMFAWAFGVLGGWLMLQGQGGFMMIILSIFLAGAAKGASMTPGTELVEPKAQPKS